jgi:hypothetical protein
MQMLTNKYDVIIIGAGVSGLAATRTLNSVGFKTLTLEATDRIGGRIYTDRSTGKPVDLGASWIHGARGNPIYDIFRKSKARLFKSDFLSTTIYFDGVRLSDKNIISDFYTYIHRRKKKFNSDEPLSATLDSYIRKREISGFHEPICRHLLSVCMETEYGANLSDLSLRWFDEDEEYAGGDIFVASGYDELVTELGRVTACCLNSPVTENIGYRYPRGGLCRR